MHEEAYKRLVKSLDKRETMYRGPKKEESTAFVVPGWGNIQSKPDQPPHDPIVQFNVKDQMYTIANSFVNSIDGFLQSYFPGESKNPTQSENFFTSFREWQKSNAGKKHDQLWELAQAKGDEDWLDWIHDHIWTYVGLSAPLLGAINPVRAVIR